MDDTQLHMVIDEARLDLVTGNELKYRLRGVLTHLGMPLADAQVLADSIVSGDYHCHRPLHELERQFRQLIPASALDCYAARMEERARGVLNKFGHHLIPGGSVLDFGGGSGEVAELIAAQGWATNVADIRDWRRNKEAINFIRVQHNTTGLTNNTFDTVLLLHVLHHSSVPEQLLREAFRVARLRVIIVETVVDTVRDFKYTAWMDWFYNRVLTYAEHRSEKVPVPCNFLSPNGWRHMAWKNFHIETRVSEDLGTYQQLSPLHHHLLVFDK